MWLLSTDRAQLRFFPDATAVPGGYAILSHTWGRDEQTFQDINALAEKCKADGTNPRDFVSDKIRGCCILAEHHGYAWAWVDSCCIDKTSSSELSESINSMFQWYSQAEVCYVYMADVHDNGDIYASDSEFRTSRWHMRGWTLQELIAPTMVIFLSKGWTFLGRRDDSNVAGLLEDVTRIPIPLLTRSTPVHEYGIATRMSWASSRSTTRLEDEAYCLMGLFDVNMPTIYGEGRRAFQRLQLEIMKDSSDTSIFASGDRISHDSFEDQGLRLFTDWDSDLFKVQPDPLDYLLARSPRNFTGEVDFMPDTMRIPPLRRCPPTDHPTNCDNFKAKSKGPFNRIELPKFRSTNYGIECRFPFVKADGCCIAVLLCQSSGLHLGLLLHEDPSGKDPTRPRYFTGARFFYTHPLINRDEEDTGWMAKIVTLGDDLYNLRFNGKVVSATWRTFYIVPSPPNLASPTVSFSNMQLELEHCLGAAFRIPHSLIATFNTLNFNGYVCDTMNVRATEDSEGVYRMFFHHIWTDERIFVELGLCPRTPTSASPSTSQRHDLTSHHFPTHTPWARIYSGHFYEFPFPWSDLELQRPSHDCDEHHIDARTMQMQTQDSPGHGSVPAERTVRLSFSPWKISPGTLVVHLELLGPVYEKILRDANIPRAISCALPVYRQARRHPLPSLCPLLVVSRFHLLWLLPRLRVRH